MLKKRTTTKEIKELLDLNEYPLWRWSNLNYSLDQKQTVIIDLDRELGVLYLTFEKAGGVYNITRSANREVYDGFVRFFFS